MKSFATGLVFLVLVLGGGLFIGFLTSPDEWYAGLAKPSFHPPDWIFAPVWSFLYILIALAGLRTFRLDKTGTAMKLWGLQLLLNFLWSPVFFTLHDIAAALFVIMLLVFVIGAYIFRMYCQDKLATWLFVPYFVWACFAFVLNISLLVLNQGPYSIIE